MSMTSESNELVISSNGVDSPFVEDANSGGTVGANVPLKKGPWTSAEDAILVEYVTQHGEGNWNAVQKHSGLARCGKSCRLRWANHLRPDLKKGAFSPEEEHRIIELHAKMGNKWARMAAELPGRTDNEIKNFWNTRIKRRQRAGLPIYPPNMPLQALNENQQTDYMNTFSSGDVHQPVPVDNLEIPAFKLKNLDHNQHFYPPALLDVSASSLLDIAPSSLITQDLHSCPSKRLRPSESMFPCSSANIGDVIPESFVLPPVYDHRHNPSSDLATSSSLLPDSHDVLLSCDPSSEPAWAMKLELPSFQSQISSCWGSQSPSSPVPSTESVDALIQTPPPAELTHSCSRNSGLLDAVLYESQTMGNSKSNGTQQNSHAPSMFGHHIFENSSHETEWEGYGEQLSPFAHSSSSVFSESNPNSLDEPLHAAETLPEESTLGLMQYEDNKAETKNHMIFSRPDLLLGSNCFGHPTKVTTQDHCVLKDAIGTLLADDTSSRDCKQVDTSATPSSVPSWA